MKFILMMQCTRAAWESIGNWTPAELKAHVEFMKRLNGQLAERGELVVAEGLEPPHSAVIVQAKGGAPAVTDGPFPETKEFLAGFWIVDCDSRARAIQIAAQASAAPGPGGTPIGIPIEVRPVGRIPDVGE